MVVFPLLSTRSREVGNFIKFAMLSNHPFCSFLRYCTNIEERVQGEFWFRGHWDLEHLCVFLMMILLFDKADGHDWDRGHCDIREKISNISFVEDIRLLA
jgi:hypothetical protein